jgi:hypothetical protein
MIQIPNFACNMPHVMSVTHAEFGPELDLGTEKEAGDFDGIEGHGGRWDGGR